MRFTLDVVQGVTISKIGTACDCMLKVVLTDGRTSVSQVDSDPVYDLVRVLILLK